MKPGSEIGKNLRNGHMPLPVTVQDALDAAIAAATAQRATAYDTLLERLIAVTDAQHDAYLWNLIDELDGAATGWRIAAGEAAYQIGKRSRRITAARM